VLERLFVQQRLGVPRAEDRKRPTREVDAFFD
jgi:hypothetical protein